MKRIHFIAICWTASLGCLLAEAPSRSNASAKPAKGPLRVQPENPRYFTDGTKSPVGSLKVVYLTGSHTWTNLVDRGPSDPPQTFDFAAYLDFLQRHGHNFIRLWARHVTWYHGYGEGELHAGPLPWVRTGPGVALDGKPRFDLSQLNPAYFERLRTRVAAAGDCGIYVSVMLFGGNYECQGGWRGNPFHAENNINGIDGDPAKAGHGLKSHTLEIAAINRLQDTYVRKVIETVGELDNVLYEISNEGHPSSAAWQNHWVQFIRELESLGRKQHPLGLTSLYHDDPAETARFLAASRADWISPFADAAGVQEIAAADGSKVSLLDSDHWFVKEIYQNPQFGRGWVWKAFCRGHQPILMEHLAPLSFVDRDYPLTTADTGYIAARRAMGHTRQFAERMEPGTMVPRNGLSSTGFCLAKEGDEYLVYQPTAGVAFSVKLREGVYEVEWFDPSEGSTVGAERMKVPGGPQQFRPPVKDDAVLYLKKVAAGL